MTQGLCGIAQTPRSVLQGASCERLEGPLERDSPETDRVEILPSRACLLRTRSSVSVMHLTVMSFTVMHRLQLHTLCSRSLFALHGNLSIDL